MKKDLTTLEVKTFDKVKKVDESPITVSDVRKLSTSKIKTEHPELAELYDDLNRCISNQYNARSRDLQRLAEVEITAIRKKIKDYRIKHNITRNDYLRWNN